MPHGIRRFFATTGDENGREREYDAEVACEQKARTRMVLKSPIVNVVRTRVNADVANRRAQRSVPLPQGGEHVKESRQGMPCASFAGGRGGHGEGSIRPMRRPGCTQEQHSGMCKDPAGGIEQGKNGVRAVLHIR